MHSSYSPLQLILSNPNSVEELVSAIVNSKTFLAKAPGVLCGPLAKTIPYCLDECSDEGPINKLAEILCKPLHCTCFSSPPLANSDSVETTLNAAIVINVAANDLPSSKFCPLDPTTLVLVQLPVNGTAVNNLDGTVTYTPDDGFVGNDTFTYRISDECCQCAEGLVVIAVVDEDLPPSCSDIEDLEVVQNENLIISLAGFYVVGTGTVDLGSGFTIEMNPINGTLVINGNGTVTYTPDLNFLGNDIMMVRVTDENGLWCIITITITTVAPELDLIVCVADEYIIGFNETFDMPVISNDTTDVLCELLPESVCITNAPNFGDAVVQLDGDIRYTPDADWCGEDTLTYKVTDSCGRSCTAVVTITVLPPGNIVTSCQVMDGLECDFMAFTIEGTLNCPSGNILLYFEDDCGKIISIPAHAALISGCIILIDINIWNALRKPGCEDEGLDCDEVKSIGCDNTPVFVMSSC